MKTSVLNQIEDIISQLTVKEQLWLVGWITRRIRERALSEPDMLESQLVAMANDPEIQQELPGVEEESA